MKDYFEKLLPVEKERRVNLMINSYVKIRSELLNVRNQVQADAQQANLLVETLENVGKNAMRVDLMFTGNFRKKDLEMIKNAKETAKGNFHRMSKEFAQLFRDEFHLEDGEEKMEIIEEGEEMEIIEEKEENFEL